MFEEYFRFSGSPFRLSPDHRFFFLSNVHKRALAHLRFGLEQAEGFILVTGEVGAGKTTLVEHILSTLNSNRYVTANIVTSNLNQDDLVRMVASAYGLEQEGLNRATVLRNLERFVAESFRRGRRCLLFVDEAQNLAISALEELRMLSNLLVNGKPALQSFLLGQPQFRDTLSKPDLAQLRQRVIASYHLGPLSAEETIEYIEHRLSLVGWSGNPQIDRSAFNAIYQLTDGVPRRINTLCTRTLLYACLEENNKITGAMVRAVAEELETELAQVLTPGTAVDPGPVVTETRDHSASNNAVQEEETQEETDRLHPARRGAVESQAMPSIAPSRPCGPQAPGRCGGRTRRS